EALGDAAARGDDPEVAGVGEDDGGAVGADGGELDERDGGGFELREGGGENGGGGDAVGHPLFIGAAGAGLGRRQRGERGGGRRVPGAGGGSRGAGGGLVGGGAGGAGDVTGVDERRPMGNLPGSGLRGKVVERERTALGGRPQQAGWRAGAAGLLGAASVDV